MPNTARWYAQGLMHAREIVMREMQGVCPTKQRPLSGALATLPSHTASFAAFTGCALMTFRAGLALNSIGSLVKGLVCPPEKWSSLKYGLWPDGGLRNAEEETQ